MDCYENLAVSYDRLTNDVDYEATVAFYYEILKREGLKPRTAVQTENQVVFVLGAGGE